MQQESQIPIFFTIDDNYAPYISVAIMSMIENASKEHKYRIHILYENLSKENINKISKLATDEFQIEFRYMKDELENIKGNVPNKYVCDYFNITIYFRLLIPDMFPEYNKGIYLDSDIVVTGDIYELYNTNLNGNLIGAVQDHSVSHIPELVKYFRYAIGVSEKEYVNSGVLLMNLEEMRKKMFCKKFLKLLHKYHFYCIAPDQDYLNAMCNGKILYLDRQWDTMPTDGLDIIANPKLVHYNLFKKPWCYDDIQYEEYFWKYAKRSEYYKQILEFKNNYTLDKKKADTEGLTNLISLAEIVPNNDITFKKVMENGEKIRI